MLSYLQTDTAHICSAGVGGIIEKSYYPQTESELLNLQKELVGEEYVILGGMTNCLLMPSYKGRAVFTDLLKGYFLRENELTVKSGESVSHMCGVAHNLSLSGLENFFGLPGTVGGAISGNSGCFGKEISEILSKVTIFSLETGEKEVLSREEIAFNYRYCNLRKNKDLILDATFNLYPDSRIMISEKMAEVRKLRKLKQPKGKSLGSFFKQYNGVSAGYFIEKAGLKGYEKNGVIVSDTHANFFVNKCGTANDYLELAEYVEKKVYEKLGIKLEREVVVIEQRQCRDNGNE